MHVIATAGHVDHGKSALVRALTGMEPDRWAEEIRRGMTIDLGFCWTSLPAAGDGDIAPAGLAAVDVAFVDVPGHERYVANMLAGVGPAPAVLFVVAADEGWRAQSEEHLAAIDALGVRHGLLAVTRSDLADPAPAIEAARARIARTSLGQVEAIAVSSVTGAGLDELRCRHRPPGQQAHATRSRRGRAAVDRQILHHHRPRHGGHRNARGGHHPGR